MGLFRKFFYPIRRVELHLSHDARVDDLIRYYKQIIQLFEPSLLTLETLFQALFQENTPLHVKVTEIAKILMEHNIELCTRIIKGGRETICEVISHRNGFRSRIIRVLHYLADGDLALTRMILI